MKEVIQKQPEIKTTHNIEESKVISSINEHKESGVVANTNHVNNNQTVQDKTITSDKVTNVAMNYLDGMVDKVMNNYTSLVKSNEGEEEHEESEEE
mmetsp:Transcript_1008/g.976  ORF Transcript_1008/g.976 Transcript_1008/m.976 type:complete len:96 (+) Transcript_1008:503-790(+)